MARRQGLTGSDWRYYHFDEIGSTRLLTDLDGMVTDSYAYDAWGNLIDRIGTTEQPYQYIGRLGYYTHYQDPAFDLLQLGVRFYDPEVGRFAQRDPLAQDDAVVAGVAAYAYASPNPMSGVDPSGKLPRLVDCTPASIEQRVRAALQKICSRISLCYPHTTGPKQQTALREFCDHGIVQCGSRTCVQHPDWCGYGPNHPGRPDTSGRCRIVICSPGFTSDCDQTGSGNPEGETILHEMFHCAGSGDPGAECRMRRCLRSGVLR